MARKSRGRQKIEMVKMRKESNLQVTFSKRRSGLFKKASELCTLCGVEIAMVVFSPGKKVFSFGHPSVPAILGRYISRNPPPQASGVFQLIEAYRNDNVRELNMQLTHVTNQLDAERKRSEELNKMRKASQAQCWWEGPLEKLQPEQLQKLKASLEELKKIVAKQAERTLIQTTNFPEFYPGSSSHGFVPQEEKNIAGFNAGPIIPPPLPAAPAYNVGIGPAYQHAGPSHGHAYVPYGRDILF